MKFVYLMLGLGLLAGVWTVMDLNGATKSDRFASVPKLPVGAEVITLGGGCFWHTQAVLERIPGVLSVTVGYMGGTTVNPTYGQVGGGKTGHTEVARVVFDPKQTDLEKILQVFWTTHRATSPVFSNGRSVIFYQADAQRQIAERSRATTAKLLSRPVMTEIAKATEFYAAEEYHQDYYKKHGNITCGL